MKLWVDDLQAAPDGWHWVWTVPEAQAILANDAVTHLSLDHDLGGACPDKCWLDLGMRLCSSDCRCACHQTGYTLVCWMEERGIWPETFCGVHSANPAGAERMRAVIERRGFDRSGRRSAQPQS